MTAQDLVAALRDGTFEAALTECLKAEVLLIAFTAAVEYHDRTGHSLRAAWNGTAA